MFGRTNEPVVELAAARDEFFLLVRGLAQAAATMPAAAGALDRSIEIICRGLAQAQ